MANHKRQKLTEGPVDDIKALTVNVMSRLRQMAGISGKEDMSAYVKVMQTEEPKIKAMVNDALNAPAKNAYQRAKDQAYSIVNDENKAMNVAIKVLTTAIVDSIPTLMVTVPAGAKPSPKKSGVTGALSASKATPAAKPVAEGSIRTGADMNESSHPELRAFIRNEVNSLLEAQMNEFSGAGAIAGYSLPLGASPAEYGAPGPISNKVRADATAAVPYGRRRKKSHAVFASLEQQHVPRKRGKKRGKK